jgi:hypothetical protein
MLMQGRVALVALVVASVVVPATGAAAAAPAQHAPTGVVPAGTVGPVDRAVDDGSRLAAGAVTTGGADAPPTQLFSESSSQSDDDSASDSSPPPDPDSDTIGWEAGYWHNESIEVDQSDGLSDAELEAFVGRAMARVEYVREREFKRDVPVSVVTREQYRARSNNSSNNASFERWNDQVWEALFIVGEDTTSAEALSNTYGSSVAGFYSPSADEIRIVTDSPDSPVIDNATLVHELVHALQDQYVDLAAPRYRGTTQDEQLAADGVVEGEANYIETVYARRCATGEWDCVDSPAAGGGGSDGPGPNLGILVTVLQPYSDGPVYVDSLLADGGWDGFETQFRHPPNTTEQVIHRTSEQPVPLTVEANATGNWTTFPDQGRNGSETVGEASIYSMFWYQTRTANADAVDLSAFYADGRFDMYDYTARPSSGWGNDKLTPYRRGEGDDAEYGYVWTTEWDTTTDAREFVTAYESILQARGGERTASGGYVIDDGPFADAFRVVHNGTRVTIVNGPTMTAVTQLRPDLAAGSTSATTNDTPTPTPTPSGPAVDDVTPATDDDDAASPTATPSPTPTAAPDGSVTTDGFGIAAVVAAVLVLALVARRRRS